MTHKSRGLALLVTAVLILVLGGQANAHKLECVKTVNGQQVFQVPSTTDPVDLEYRVEVFNPLSYSYSTVRGLEDPVGVELGANLDFPDPEKEYFNIDPLDSYVVTYTKRLENPYEDCKEYDLLDGTQDRNIVNIFTASWPSGYDSCYAVVKCPEKPCEYEVDIEKSVIPDRTIPGQELYYTIKVTNKGNCPLTNVKVTDLIPTYELPNPVEYYAYTVLETSPVGEVDVVDGIISWDEFDLDLDESKRLYIKVELDAGVPIGERVKNVACVDAEEIDDAECTYAKVTIVDECEDDLVIIKEVDRAGALPGEAGVRYTITIENNGICKLHNVKVIETLPSFWMGSYIHWAFHIMDTDPKPDGPWHPRGFYYDVGDLEVGGKRTFQFTVQMDEHLPTGHEVSNIACVFATGLGLRCDTAKVGILPRFNNDAEDHIGSIDFWCDQIGEAMEDPPNGKFDKADLEQWLENIKHGFDPNDWPDVTQLNLPLAEAIFCGRVPQGLGLPQQLLALLLNIESGQVGLETRLRALCFDNDYPVPQGANMLWALQYLVDEAKLKLGEDPTEQQFWKYLIEAANNAQTPPWCHND